jgi:hypothetical protein
MLGLQNLGYLVEGIRLEQYGAENCRFGVQIMRWNATYRRTVIDIFRASGPSFTIRVERHPRYLLAHLQARGYDGGVRLEPKIFHSQWNGNFWVGWAGTEARPLHDDV